MKDDRPEQDIPRKIILESLLFVATEPVATQRLAEVLEMPPEEVEVALQELEDDLKQHGFRLQRHKDQVQLVTAPEAAPYVERFLGLDLTSKLSAAALEALGIIAYRQPITRAQVEAIRGVSCDGVLRTLLGHGLIEECGRLEQAGRPILYGTTFQFLQHFGLTGYDQLPPLQEAEGDNSQLAVRQAGCDPVVKFLKE